jgi:hypothetical protein
MFDAISHWSNSCHTRIDTLLSVLTEHFKKPAIMARRSTEFE